MLQLLSPAGSPEAVIAAVQGGADTVYLGYGATEAGRNEKGFSPEELSQSLRYCRIRDCRTAVALNGSVTDKSIRKAVERAVYAVKQGAEALLVHDIGLITVLRQILPDVPLWGGVRMGIHDRDGALAAAALGLSRITLAPELTLEQIEVIAKNVPVETAICVHGPLCFAHAGQCHMSVMTDRQHNDSCLHCSEPCRGRFSLGGRMDEYPMSMADICLVDHLEELEEAGAHTAMIVGRSRRPEYVFHVTQLYARAIREKVPPTKEEHEELQSLFAPNGLTDGYLTGDTSTGMYGPPPQMDRAMERAYSDIRKQYMGGELRRVPVKFYAVIQQGRAARFAAEDEHGHRAVYQGYAPIDLGRQGITPVQVQDVLYRTGGTPYNCVDIQCVIDPHMDYAAEALEEARRAMLTQITDQNRELPPAPVVHKGPPVPEPLPQEEPLKLIIQVSREEQLSPALAQSQPDYLYVPAELLAAGCRGIEPFRDEGAQIVAVLPRIVTDSEMPVLRELLATLTGMGIDQALVSDLGLVPTVLSAGMVLRGDLGLNLTNSWAIQRLGQSGFESVTASFQLSARQIKGLSKSVRTEMIIYGRVPVMITEHCLIRNSAGRCSCTTPTSMSSPFGDVYPVEKEFGCRNVIYDSSKIFLADKPEIFESAGLWGARLLFTTESERECASVAGRYRGQNHYRPNNTSRGLYPKGAL